MTTVKHVLLTHDELCSLAKNIVAEKGHDYNYKQQMNGDTLFNLTVCQKLGIVDHVTQGILVRLSDKFMRLSSLASDPTRNPKVSNESVRDTIVDTINYLIYLYIKYQEVREFAKSEPKSKPRKRKMVRKKTVKKTVKRKTRR